MPLLVETYQETPSASALSVAELFTPAPSANLRKRERGDHRSARDLPHFPLERPGNIGLPAPGVRVKLVPNESPLEIRVKART